MGVRRILRSGAALVAIALVASPAASAFTPTDHTVSTSGALIYSWHGDPSRGCARVGVCGIQGTLVVRAQGPGDLFIAAPRKANFSFADTSAIVRVRRAETGSEGDCIDTNVWPNTGYDAMTVSWQRSGRARIDLASGPGPSSGRCAGPLPGDLPATLPGRRLPGPRLGFTFAGTMGWAAGPYSGALISTLVFRPDASAGSSGGVTETSQPPPTAPNPPRRKLLDERVTVTYRVTAAPGSIFVSLRGGSGAFCDVLDSCGTSGMLSLAFGGKSGQLTVVGDRIVRRPVGGSQALADFRAGRLEFGLPMAPFTRRFAVSETLDRAGGATCVDRSSAASGSLTWLGSPFIDLQSKVRLRSLPVVLETFGSQDEFVRTHCPGPDGSDVFGDNQILAQGRIGLAELLHRSSQVVLRPASGFGAPGYSGSLTGGLRLQLSLVKVVAKTIRVPT